MATRIESFAGDKNWSAQVRLGTEPNTSAKQDRTEHFVPQAASPANFGGVDISPLPDNPHSRLSRRTAGSPGKFGVILPPDLRPSRNDLLRSFIRERRHVFEAILFENVPSTEISNVDGTKLRHG